MRSRECDRAYELKVPLILESNFMAQWSNLDFWLDLMKGKLQIWGELKFNELSTIKKAELMTLLSGTIADMKYFISSDMHIKMFIKSLQDFFLLPDFVLNEAIVNFFHFFC